MLNSNLFWNIIEFIATLIECLVFKFILDKFSERKKSKLVVNISIGLNIIFIMFLNIININNNINLFIRIITGYLFYMYNYKINIFKGLIGNLLYWMILVGIDISSVNIILIMNSTTSISKLLNYNRFRIELIIISKLLLVLMIPIVNRFKFNIDFKKKEFFYIIIPIIANISSIVSVFTLEMQQVNRSETHKIIIIMVLSMLVISNITLIKIIVGIVKSKYIKEENKLIKEKVNMQYQFYLSIQESQTKVRKLYHDMKNHISCIEKLYGNNDISNKYIESIKNELNSSQSIIYTENIILDIIVNEKKEICSINNIDFKVDVNFSKCGFIDIIDVCSIFSNMIDNAIESCIKVNESERFIRIKGSIVNRLFVVKCENSKINKIKLKNNKIITTKKDSRLHGLGIKSIESSVQKYGGEISIDFSDCIFGINIYIPLR